MSIAETATCRICGERIYRRVFTNFRGAWLHEPDSAGFRSPHEATPKVAA